MNLNAHKNTYRSFQISISEFSSAVSDGADQRIVVLHLSVDPLVCEWLTLRMSRWLQAVVSGPSA